MVANIKDVLAVLAGRDAARNVKMHEFDWQVNLPHLTCISGVHPRRAARRYLRVRGAARADSRGPGAGLAPRQQALPIPAAAMCSPIR